MKNFLVASTLFVLSGLAYAADYPTDLTGKYECECTEVGTHVNYQGVMTVKKTGQTYAISSVFNDGSSYSGTGMYDSNKHNFVIAFINPKNAQETGVASAEVASDSSMAGTWTYLNNTEISSSSCKRTG